MRRKAGNPPYRRLAEQAHYSISTLSSAASGQRLPTLAVTLAYVRACDGDTEEWRERWREVAEVLGEVGSEPEGGGPAPPYAGLRSFQEQDSEWFFGRERLLEELAGRLERQRFVVVIGASGSGKSSLLRAGLVPRLREAEGTTVVVLTPGARPLEECAVRLGAMAGLAPGALYGELRDDPENLGRVVRQITARDDDTGDRELVLVVDQFEEVFTLCRDTAERDRFIEALVLAASAPGGRCRVALGARADFYAHCTHHAPLVEAMRDAQVPVGPMSLDELRRAVVQPAQRAGLTIEGALLATLIAQAHGQAGVLPLLSHALLQTWRRRRGNALTRDAFEAAGGLEGALARTAEEFYQGLDAGRRQLARQVFVRLTALGDGTEDTRRPARLEELDGLPGAGEGAGDGEVRAVLDLAAGARLVARARLTGYTDGVMSVAFAPDGRTLAAASADKKVRLYGLTAGGDAGEPVLLTAHTKPVDTVAFSRDGRTLATGSEDWTALLWDPDIDRVAGRICTTAYPTITRAEWRQYFPH